MKKYFFAIIIIIVFLYYISGYSQSAVYFCETTGKYGYAYGATLDEVKQSAYKACLKNGGKNPKLIVYTEDKGYGAIVLGTDPDGYRIIGAAVGYSSASSASDAALEVCKNYGCDNCKIEVKWYDK
ncbi:MAG: hypothetical protein N2490_00230 [Ignavibacteria bacterium]|nr:hypothetical protein [Ignavibacteria bacterium]